jgi:hypothetical protein
MDGNTKGNLSNNRKKIVGQQGFTLLETVIASALSLTIISITLMVFLNVNTSVNHVYLQQDTTDNLIGLQQIKPHIRYSKYLSEQDGTLLITKKDYHEVKLFVTGHQLWMEEWSNNSLLHKKSLLKNVTSFHVICYSPTSVKLTVQADDKEYVITEHSR